MTFFAGMSQREIASVTSLPLGTVKTRIELGLRKLAHLLVTARLEMA
jgi:RNA polymerase sigma-70 factor (ECF subfamily)